METAKAEITGITDMDKNKLRLEYPENVFIWATKKNPRKLEKVLLKIPEILNMAPSVLSENVRSDMDTYCGLRVNADIKLSKGQTGFAVQIPYGFDLRNALPGWVNFVRVDNTDKDERVFKPITPEQFFVNKKGKAI